MNRPNAISGHGLFCFVLFSRHLTPSRRPRWDFAPFSTSDSSSLASGLSGVRSPTLWAAVSTCLVLRGGLVSLSNTDAFVLEFWNRLLAIMVIWGAAFLCQLRQQAVVIESRLQVEREGRDQTKRRTRRERGDAPGEERSTHGDARCGGLHGWPRLPSRATWTRADISSESPPTH